MIHWQPTDRATTSNYFTTFPRPVLVLRLMVIYKSEGINPEKLDPVNDVIIA
jgi:hypothetical protein